MKIVRRSPLGQHHRKTAAVLLLVAALGGAGWLLSCGPHHQGLVFEKTEISEQARPSQTEVVARFPFQNRGSRPVRIVEVKTDCSCTAAKPVQEFYAPGERGEIAVSFKIGVRSGVQRKGFVVKTDAPGEAPTPLALIISIPEVLTLPTSVLLWTEHEASDAKSLIVKTSDKVPVKELRVRTDSPFLAVSVGRETPTEFRVQVTPSANQRNISAALQLEAILEGDERKVANAYVRVR
jgi:hypothetical protein